jgi:hypothetical protein
VTGVARERKCRERLAHTVLSLSTGTTAGPDEVLAVVGILRFALQHAAGIGPRLGRSRTRGGEGR